MKSKEDKKNFLYRIMTVERTKELFENNELVFLKPEAWKDPFENYLSKVSFIDTNGKTHHIDYLKNVYGQCYSLGKETSLMWDAYSPDGNSIRVKYDRDKLVEFLKTQNQYPGNNFMFDKVTYKRYGDFISKLKDDVELTRQYNNQNSDLLKYFFEKRYEYRDEREYRIMYDANSDNEVKTYGKYLRVKIPLLDLIDTVRYDPKMSEKKCEELTIYFKEKGIDGRKIQRSLLYKYEMKKKVKLI